MTKKRIKNLVAFFLTAILAAAVILSLYFAVSPPTAAKKTESVLNQWNESIAAVRISDVGKINSLIEVNYSPDEFVQPGNNPKGKIIELNNNFSPANRGTYQFTLLNLDPSDVNFNENAKALERFLQGDSFWHLTMFLPNVLSACNVYVGNVLTNRIGEIEGYDFSNYTDNFQVKTETHKNATEPIFLDLRFYTKRNVIPDGNPLLAAQVVTIHYETDGALARGLVSAPIIGTDAAVKAAVSRDNNLITTFVIIAAMSLAVFVFLCFLKRTVSFVPQLLIPLGVLFTFLSGFILSSATSAPYLWVSVGNFGLAFILFAAVTALRFRVKKFPLWLFPTAFALINCFIAFFSPLFPSVAFNALSLYLKIANSIVSIIIIGFATFFVIKDEDALSLVNPLLAGIAGLTTYLLPSPFFAAVSPAFWLFAAIILAAIAVSFREFVGLERKNLYLTSNLKNEIERQTNDLKSLLNERDNLLRHVSHDMKKPVSSMVTFLDILKKRERDAEQLKTINIVKQKTDELKRDFDELNHYAKQNFIAETSITFDVNDALSLAYENIEPDCTACGIVLKYAPVSISVFGKKNALTSVLNNLILNAVEHAKCKTISLSASKSKNLCIITVTDDGKGISAGKDVFSPYTSEHDSSENLGIGLFICKSMMNSMGGDISYKQKEGCLTFLLTMPIS